MNARENASVNVLSRAVDGALNILNATAGDSDMENVQWRIRETKRVLSAALREVTVAPEAGGKAVMGPVTAIPTADELPAWCFITRHPATTARLTLPPLSNLFPSHTMNTNTHLIEATYRGPTDTRGSRVVLTSHRFPKDTISDGFDSTGWDIREQAKRTIETLGYTVVAEGETQKGFFFAVAEFLPLKEQLVKWELAHKPKDAA